MAQRGAGNGAPVVTIASGLSAASSAAARVSSAALVVGKRDINLDVAAVDPAEPAHAPKGHSAFLTRGIAAAPTNPDHDVTDAAVLLRIRRERPRRRRTPEY